MEDVQKDTYKDFVGRRVKIVYRDKEENRAIRGEFVSHDTHTIVIKGDRDGNPVVIGKNALIMMRIDDDQPVQS